MYIYQKILYFKLNNNTFKLFKLPDVNADNLDKEVFPFPLNPTKRT